ILRTVLQQFTAEGNGIAGLADKFEQDQIDLRILGEEGTRLADVLGGVDRVEFLRVERIEQDATVFAVGGHDKYRTIDPFRSHQLTQRPSRSLGGELLTDPGENRSTRES